MIRNQLQQQLLQPKNKNSKRKKSVFHPEWMKNWLFLFPILHLRFL